jgi:hypothetical protein
MTEKVTIEDLRRLWETNAVVWIEWKRSIQSYADQAREEARAEAQLVIDDLRDQLEGALVPKFKVGDKVNSSETGPEIIKGAYVAYEVEGSGEIRYREDYFAPLETECQHEDSEGNPWVNQTFWGFNAFVFCPSCGESLTKETP